MAGHPIAWKRGSNVSNDMMTKQIAQGMGFLAALDQSGGSTPSALRHYGVPDNAYASEAAMFKLVHEMRTRIMCSPAFQRSKVIGAILFEATMDNDVQGMPTTKFLWDKRGVVPFLKIDKGLEAETDGVQLMKPIPGLDALLQRAASLGVFGTKMRSVINTASKTGIAAVVKQQFEIGEQISGHGLMPIIEPEISIKSPSKADCEAILRDEILSALKTLPAGRQVMLKLTIPDAPNFYAPLIDHPGVLKVVALSGGYTRDDACKRLAENKGMIASFSRALVEDLTYSMTDPAFDAALAHNIEEIYQASVSKH